MDALETIIAEREAADQTIEAALAGAGDLSAALSARMEADRRHAELLREIVPLA